MPIFDYMPDEYTEHQKENLNFLHEYFEIGKRYERKMIDFGFRNTGEYLNLAEYGHVDHFGHTLVYENPNTGDATFAIFSIIHNGQDPIEFTCLVNEL